MFAFSRSALHEAPGVSMGAIDVLDETSIAAAATAASADGPLDLVLVATGLLHDKEPRPEKSMRELEAEAGMARLSTPLPPRCGPNISYHCFESEGKDGLRRFKRSGR